MPRLIRFDGLTGLALPMLVWALHFLAVYVLAGLACARGWSTQSVAGLTPTAWWLLVCGLVAVTVLAFLARGAWLSTPPPSLHGGADGMPMPRRHFIARACLALCVLAAIAVVLTTVPVLLLPTCG